VVVNLPPFQRLLDEHGAALHRFCLAQVGPDHGPDCFQEAVLAALRAYPGVRSDTNLRGWLFTIAHHKVIDHHRAARRRPVAVGDAGAAAGHGDRPPRSAAAETPVAVVDAHLWEAVGALPAKQRGAVTLRFLGDLPYAEIATALGCSEAAARQNVRAGLASLRMEVPR
jgi:RNA polymerase sigma factor (sigma-70 family)